MDYIRISVADNGYILAYDDPEIREQNRKSDSSWQDPGTNPFRSSTSASGVA